MARLRRYICGSLWFGAALLAVLVVSSVLWTVLNAVGDHIGAAGARGVTLVTLVCSVLNFVVLVVLLAVDHLQWTGRVLDGEQEHEDETVDAD